MKVVNRSITTSVQDGQDVKDLSDEDVINDIPDSYLGYIIVFTEPFNAKSENDREAEITMKLTQSFNGGVLFTDVFELDMRVEGEEEISAVTEMLDADRYLYSDMDYALELEGSGDSSVKFDGNQDITFGVAFPARTL